MNNRVLEKENESLYSFLFRTAIENYFDHLGSMVKEIAATVYSSNCNYLEENYVTTGTLKDLAKMLEVDISNYILNPYDELLVHSINPPNEKAALFQSHRVYEKYHTKYCPECIKEDYYHRLEWDISLVTMCHKHQNKLIDVCPKCQRRILLGRFMSDECKCGFHFSETDIFEKEMDPMVLEAQNVIYKYLKGEPFQNFINIELSAKDYFFLFFNLCSFMDYKDGQKFSSFKHISLVKKTNFLKRNKGKRTVDTMRFITTAGHFFTVQPKEHLPELFKVCDELRKISMVSYHSSYSYFMKLLNHPEGWRYKEVYDDYLDELTDEYVNERTMLKGGPREKKYLTRLEAMKLIKTEWSTLMNLCNYNLLTLHTITKEGRVISLIERESVMKYLTMKKESMTQLKLGAYIGANFHITTGLLERGIIKATHGPKTDGYPIWYIKKSEGEKFLKRLIDLSLETTVYINSSWVHFEKVNQMLMRYEIDTIDLVELLLKGKLRFTFVENKTKIKNILINIEDFNLLLFKKKREIILNYGFRTRELGKVLKCGQKKIEQWIEEGKLNIGFEKHIRGGALSRYVSLSTLKPLLMSRNRLLESEIDSFIDEYLKKQQMKA